MELRHLRYFVEVARSGTYHAAADALQVAQPALWQQVQALQRELGVPLFERAGRRVRLTRGGAVLLEQAERVVAAADRLNVMAGDLRAGRWGVLAIACYTPHLERFLAPVIGRFERAHPDVRIEVHQFAATGGAVSSIPAAIAELMAGEVDLAVGPRSPSGVEGFKVDESWVVALVARAHPWAERSSIEVGLLRGEPLLLQAGRESFSRSAVDRACHAAGFEPRVKLESPSTAALAALAENGVGVALLPDALVPSGFAGVVLPIRGAGDSLLREAWLCWRQGGLTSGAARAFVEEARIQTRGR